MSAQQIHFGEVCKIAGAFVGVIVGAGFASGRELMQFFGSFGWPGVLGIPVAGALFVFFAMTLATLGKQYASASHKPVIYAICGRWLGLFVDVLIAFLMFAVAVVMLAGGGAILEQMAGIPALWGNIATLVLTIGIVCLDLRRVIGFIGSVTPLLLVVTLIVAVMSLTNRDMDWAALEVTIVQEQQQAASHWFVAALLYVSYNLIAGAPFLIIMAGQSANRRTAVWGGIAGGLLLTALMLLIVLGMFSQVDKLSGVAMPTLLLASQLSPVLGALMAVTVFGMILNTAVGMVYAFCARILTPQTPQFRWAAVAVTVLAFLCSLVGFMQLIGFVYPAFGWLGFVLMACTAAAFVRCKLGLMDAVAR